MRRTCSGRRPWTLFLTASLAVGCQQSDQALPFALGDGEGTTLTVGSEGGVVSLPPSFSIDLPAGAVSAPVTIAVTPRLDAPFPSDQGTPVPGTAFDMGPVGTALDAPARVELAVDASLLGGDDDVRLALGLVREDGSVSTSQGRYDAANGLLSAEIDEIGPVAAVVSADAIPVALESPPALLGGAIPPPEDPSPVGPAAASAGGVEFTASCSPTGRQCFSSGMIRLWADDVVRDRLGDRVFLLDPSLDASLDFLSFDANGLPTELVGSIRLGGELRARLNTSVTRYGVEDGVTTGPSVTPTATPLQVSGNVMVVSQTTGADGSVAFDEEVEFSVTGIGTSEMLVVELQAEMEFDNDVGPPSVGLLTAHIRLRR